MLKLAEAIDNHAEKLVAAESFDNGKPEWLQKLLTYLVALLTFVFCYSNNPFDSKSHDMDGAALNYTLKNLLVLQAAYRHGTSLYIY